MKEQPQEIAQDKCDSTRNWWERKEFLLGAVVAIIILLLALMAGTEGSDGGSRTNEETSQSQYSDYLMELETGDTVFDFTVSEMEERVNALILENNLTIDLRYVDNYIMSEEEAKEAGITEEDRMQFNSTLGGLSYDVYLGDGGYHAGVIHCKDDYVSLINFNLPLAAKDSLPTLIWLYIASFAPDEALRLFGAAYDYIASSPNSYEWYTSAVDYVLKGIDLRIGYSNSDEIGTTIGIIILPASQEKRQFLLSSGAVDLS